MGDTNQARTIGDTTRAALFHDDGYRAFLVTRDPARADVADCAAPMRLVRSDAGLVLAGLQRLIDSLTSRIARARLHQTALRLNRGRA